MRIIVVLPAPLGPRKPNAHAARHPQVDAVDRGALAEALGQAVRLDRRRRRVLEGSCRASTLLLPGSGCAQSGIAPRAPIGIALRAVEADEPALHRPAAELVAARELQLAQHRRHVRLDGLHRDPQALGDLLVHVAAGDVAQHLALARRQLVELGSGRLRAGRAPAAPARTRRARSPPDAGRRPRPRRPPAAPPRRARRRRSSSSRSRAHPARITAITSSAASDTDSARKRTRGCPALTRADHLHAAAVRHVHVEQHHIRALLARSRRPPPRRSPASPTTATSLAELGAHARAEQVVIVDDHHAGRSPAARRRVRVASSRGAPAPCTSSTSVPSPGGCAPLARAAVALHAPDDRVAHAAPVGGDRVRVEADAAVAHEHLARGRARPPRTGRRARCRRTSRRSSSPRAPPARSPRAPPSSGPSPTVTTSIGTPCSSSTSAAARSSAAATLSPCPGSGRSSSQRRSSRSWRRARPATSRGSPARFWISASVCSTESCRWAATSARSCSRMRAARSNDRLRPSRTNHGASSRPSDRRDDRDRPRSPRRGCAGRPAVCSSEADRERDQQRAEHQPRSVDAAGTAQVLAQRGPPARRSLIVGADVRPPHERHRRRRRAPSATRPSRRNRAPEARTPTSSTATATRHQDPLAPRSRAAADALALGGDGNQRPRQRVDRQPMPPTATSSVAAARTSRPRSRNSGRPGADAAEQPLVGVAAQRPARRIRWATEAIAQ